MWLRYTCDLHTGTRLITFTEKLLQLIVGGSRVLWVGVLIL